MALERRITKLGLPPAVENPRRTAGEVSASAQRKKAPRGSTHDASCSLCAAWARDVAYAEKDEPQPQVRLAFGLMNLKPAPCMLCT